MLAIDHFFDANDRWRNPTCLSYSAASEADGDAEVGLESFDLFGGGGTVMPAFCARLGRRRFLNLVRSLLLQDPYIQVFGVCKSVHNNYAALTYPLSTVSRSFGYFSISRLEIVSRSCGVGRDVCSNINVERECTISARAPFVRTPVSIALVVGFENLVGKTSPSAQSAFGSLQS